MYMNVLALQVHWEVYGLDILCCLWSFYFAKLTSGIKNPRTANAPSFLSFSHLEECPTADKSSSGDVIRVLMNGRNRLKSNICFISSGASSLCTPAFSPRVKSFSSASSVTKGKNKTKEIIPAVVICGGWSANWVSSVVLRWETPPWRSNSFPPYESHLEVVYLFICVWLLSSTKGRLVSGPPVDAEAIQLRSGLSNQQGNMSGILRLTKTPHHTHAHTHTH